VVNPFRQLLNSHSLITNIHYALITLRPTVNAIFDLLDERGLIYDLFGVTGPIPRVWLLIFIPLRLLYEALIYGA